MWQVLVSRDINKTAVKKYTTYSHCLYNHYIKDNEN